MIKNQEEKINTLTNFHYITTMTLNMPKEMLEVLFNAGIDKKDLKPSIIAELIEEILNNKPVQDISRKIRCLSAINYLNQEVLTRNIPARFGKESMEHVKEFTKDIDLIDELIEELRAMDKSYEN